MFAKSLVAVCVVVLSTACAVEPGRSEATSSTEQGILLPCTGETIWTRYWTQNGVEVGREDCNCDGIIIEYGTLSGAFSQVVGPSCSVDAPPSPPPTGCSIAPVGGATASSAPPTCP